MEIKIVGKTDIRTLEKSIHSNTGVSNRKMRIDITRIKEIINTKEVEEIQWMDGLTKEGGRVELLRRYVGGQGEERERERERRVRLSNELYVSGGEEEEEGGRNIGLDLR